MFPSSRCPFAGEGRNVILLVLFTKQGYRPIGARTLVRIMRATITKNDREVCNIDHPERIDLREDPGAIARIDCARQYPNLGALLLNLNADESPFATFGCKVWTSTEGSGAESTEFASRIDLILSPATAPGESQYDDLARRLAELLEREPGDALRAQLHISPAQLAGGRRGFCLRFFLFARGAWEKQTQLRWNLGLARVQQAILFLARAIRQNR